MHCQCGRAKTPSTGRADILNCEHCDRRCSLAACERCANLGHADGIGPKTREGRSH